MSTTPITPPTEPVTPPLPLPEGVDVMEKLPDGKWHVKLATGEDFSGNDLEVMGKMGSAHVSTKRWAQEQVNRTQNPPPPAPVQTPEDQQAVQLREWMMDQTAQGLGYKSAQEMRSALTEMRQSSEASSDERVSMEFHATCWDFPASPENTEKLFQTGVNYGIIRANDKGELTERPTAKQLAAAHMVAVQQGVYKPMTKEEYQLAASAGPGPRITPPNAPPIVQGNQPELNNPQGDVWNMPLDKLRDQVLREQANRR